MNEAPQESQHAKAGRKGGKKLLRKRGRDYFRKLAAKRKTFGGGRPPKKKDTVATAE